MSVQGAGFWRVSQNTGCFSRVLLERLQDSSAATSCGCAGSGAEHVSAASPSARARAHTHVRSHALTKNTRVTVSTPSARRRYIAAGIDFPDVPQLGDLNIESVLQSDYFFS